LATDFKHIESSAIACQTQPSSLLDKIKANIKGMRFNLMEFSGGLGDLGTFIPLVAGISIVTGMDIGMILIFAGLANIATGLIFGLPIPVQPMKAIAAVAIAEQLLPAEIAAAGLIAGAIVFTLGVSGIIEKIEHLVPKAIIRGIQLGVGLKLVLKGITFINGTPLLGLNSIVVAAFLGMLIILLKRIKNFPSALFLFLTGLMILFILSPSLLAEIKFSLPSFSILVPSAENWLNGFTKGALPQVPLTLLNSVFAICILSGDLFPGQKVSSRRMATSVGLMNLLGCCFGGLPMCHGSGGLAGQYHFGARTGGSVVLLGIWKLLFGLFLGVTAMNIIQQYPLSILGIMLIFAGVELCLPVRDQKTIKNICVVIATVVGILGVNTGIGFLVGLMTYSIIGLSKY
jgi:Molybdate transporter of MFS superfamily